MFIVFYIVQFQIVYTCSAFCFLCDTLIDPWYVCMYQGADKSLARPGRKQAVSVKSVMGRGMD